jgi:tRNA(Ile)-lysidine synthase
MMKVIEQKVLRFIKENNLILSGDKTLIALSGGPDSIFLLHFLNKFRKKFKIEIGAAHINHLLRGKDSERDKVFCKAVCNELAVPLYILHKDVKSYAKKNKLSLEAAGRKIRYEFFERISKSNKYIKIATAHNADDNAETVLLNLIKGTGPKGIAGIPVWRDNIIRPILSLSKNEILDYLNANKFEFRIDESNQSSEFERNFLRNDVIPLIRQKLNPALSSTILNSSINFQKLNMMINKMTNELKSGCVVKSKKYVSIPINLFNEAEEIILLQMIKNIVDENFLVQTASNDLKKIRNLAVKQSGRSEELTEGLLALRERKHIIIKKKSLLKKEDQFEILIGETKSIGGIKLSIRQIGREKANPSADPTIEFIDAEKVRDKFVVRIWMNGDKFSPIGLRGTKKISDYLNDIKIDSSEKKNQLVLINHGKIVWVIGKRLDDHYKITKKTKKVLELCLQKTRRK